MNFLHLLICLILIIKHIEKALIKHYDLLHIDFLKDYCEEIRQETTDHLAVENKLRFLLDYYSIINFKATQKEGFFFRARKLLSDEAYNFTYELAAPPIYLTPANRLNRPLDPVYYLARNMLCALDEINTNKGDRVQIMVYEPKIHTFPCFAIIGEKKNVFRRGVSKYSVEIGSYLNKALIDLFNKDQTAFQSFIFLDSFLSDLLTDKKAAGINYIHTQSMLRLIQEKYPQINGFMYDGVASEGAINIALDINPAESFLKPISTFTVEILEKYGYGMYKYNIEKKSKRILANGKIEWQDLKNPIIR